ncbi:MAG: cupredoxin domain-containing protein [Actinobacteria bacterium]|nr:cupredoxin domain-containing protein [Actinomycetota bacterium]
MIVQRSKALPVVMVVAALATVLLGGSDSIGASTAATKVVTVDDNSYSRSSMTIRKNDKIKFNWGSPVNEHNVTSDSSPARFHSRTTSSDSYSYTRKFTKTGTYSLFCGVHPDDMKLKVRVKRRS